MATQLGFFVIEMGAQFVGDTVSEQKLLEVRNGLGFTDLHRGSGPSLRVRDRLNAIRGDVARYAERWSETVNDPDLAERLGQLRRSGMQWTVRNAVLGEVRDLNKARGRQGGW